MSASPYLSAPNEAVVKRLLSRLCSARPFDGKSDTLRELHLSRFLKLQYLLKISPLPFWSPGRIHLVHISHSDWRHRCSSWWFWFGARKWRWTRSACGLLLRHWKIFVFMYGPWRSLTGSSSTQETCLQFWHHRKQMPKANPDSALVCSDRYLLYQLSSDYYTEYFSC